MITNNPYAKEKRELILQIENCNDKVKRAELYAKYNEAENKSREFIQNLLEQLGSKTYVAEQKVVEVKKEYPSITKQYKMMCEGYREVMRVVELYREAKKEIREEIQAEREAKKKVKQDV